MEERRSPLFRATVSVVKLLRPQFLIAGLVLNLLGIAVAIYLGVEVDWAKAAVFQLLVAALQLVGATANEHADVESDKLNGNRTWFSGGSGMVASGRVSKKVAAYATVLWSIVALAAAAGLVFEMGSGTLLLWMALIGLGLALSYSLRPLRFSYNGFGELAMAFMVSFLVPVSSFYVQSGEFDNLIVLASAPLVFQMLGLMMVVQYPDYEADQVAGKRNLVVRLGRNTSWRLGILMLVLGSATALYGGLFGLPSSTAAIAGAVLLFEAVFFWFLPGRLTSKSSIFWSTAASCGFYVLVISVLAATFAFT